MALTEPAWLHATNAVAARNGTASHTIPFGFTSTSGNLLVVIVNGAVTNTVTGWTEQLQPVNSAELSVFTKTSTGDSSITVAHNGSDYAVNWAAFEFQSGSTWTGGIGASDNTKTFPTLTGLPTTNQIVFGVLGKGLSSSTDHSGSATWNTPWVEDVDLNTLFNVTDGAYLTVGHQINTSTTSVTPVATIATMDAPADIQKVTFAITVNQQQGSVSGTVTAVRATGTGSAAAAAVDAEVSVSGAGPIVVNAMAYPAVVAGTAALPGMVAAVRATGTATAPAASVTGVRSATTTAVRATASGSVLPAAVSAEVIASGVVAAALAVVTLAALAVRATGGGTVTTGSVTLEGIWDGSAVQPLTIDGYWDGSAVQSVSLDTITT